MRRLFNRFVKEAKINAKKTNEKAEKRDEVLRKLTVLFSKWLSGYKDKEKNHKRFDGNERVNKFMVRKYLQKLALQS